MILLYNFFTEFAPGANPNDTSAAVVEESKETMQSIYPMWQDVHVMIYIGFGFLMVFLKTHCWTSVGFNYLLSAWAFQWGILVVHFWHCVFKNEWNKAELGVSSLVIGDFAAGACMITFGAILGKADLFQCWVLITFEIIFYALNEAIGVEVFGAVDMGGSMYIHTFGAYFGLAATYFFNPKRAIADENNRGVGGYNSQLVAMVGTIFLYMYWPSFNAALAPHISRERIVVGTAIAISASNIAACAVSRLIHLSLDMEIVLNATIAGGVAIGACTDLIATPGIAIIIGAIAGTVSALGFAYLSKFLQGKIILHDTCGVHNLHGIPGILGGVFGAIAVTQAGAFKDVEAQYILFPMMKEGRTLSEQAGYQLAALGCTFAIAILGGLISGLIASKIGRNVEQIFGDEDHWEAINYDIKTKDAAIDQTKDHAGNLKRGITMAIGKAPKQANHGV